MTKKKIGRLHVMTVFILKSLATAGYYENRNILERLMTSQTKLSWMLMSEK